MERKEPGRENTGMGPPGPLTRTTGSAPVPTMACSRTGTCHSPSSLRSPELETGHSTSLVAEITR